MTGVRLYCMLALALFTVAPPDLLAPPRQDDPARRQTIGGAWRRLERRLEPVTRQDEFDSVNVGARGRQNATRAAARNAEHLGPSVVDRPLSDR
jgi:hypothetical protein